jgi:hypothetical protein
VRQSGERGSFPGSAIEPDAPRCRPARRATGEIEHAVGIVRHRVT